MYLRVAPYHTAAFSGSRADNDAKQGGLAHRDRVAHITTQKKETRTAPFVPSQLHAHYREPLGHHNLSLRCESFGIDKSGLSWVPWSWRYSAQRQATGKATGQDQQHESQLEDSGPPQQYLRVSTLTCVSWSKDGHEHIANRGQYRPRMKSLLPS